MKWAFIVALFVVGCGKVSPPVATEPEIPENNGEPIASHQTTPTTQSEPFNITFKSAKQGNDGPTGLDSLNVQPWQKKYILDAKATIESIVIEGLPDYNRANFTLPGGAKVRGSIDDLLIYIRVKDSTGSAALADGVALVYRNKNGTFDVWNAFDEDTQSPFIGIIGIYTDLIFGSYSSTKWKTIIMHEIFHVMGFDQKDLNNVAEIEKINGVTFFKGENAILGYRDILYNVIGEKTAFAIPDLRVPMEEGGFHWKHPEVKWDIMQPHISGSNSLCTKVTLGALADLGYVVDMSQAKTPSRYATKPVVTPDFICDGQHIHAVVQP